MTRHSKVVSPVLILDLISGDDELEVQEDVVLEHLPESVLQDVIRISRWLVEYGRNQGESAHSPCQKNGSFSLQSSGCPGTLYVCSHELTDHAFASRGLGV